jgi:hypothetical protein
VVGAGLFSKLLWVGGVREIAEVVDLGIHVVHLIFVAQSHDHTEELWRELVVCNGLLAA